MLEENDLEAKEEGEDIKIDIMRETERGITMTEIVTIIKNSVDLVIAKKKRKIGKTEEIDSEWSSDRFAINKCIQYLIW